MKGEESEGEGEGEGEGEEERAGGRGEGTRANSLVWVKRMEWEEGLLGKTRVSRIMSESCEGEDTEEKRSKEIKRRGIRELSWENRDRGKGDRKQDVKMVREVGNRAEGV